MKILVSGGAGYIGSHTVVQLVAAGYDVVARRPGDVATSYADPSKANRELGWSTEKTVDDMAADTWRWQSQNPRGFAG